MTKKEKAQKEKSAPVTTETRPLINPDCKNQPVRQIFSGFEIEKRFLLLTVEEDTSKSKNATTIYNEVLEKGTPIKQGYIHDVQKAKEVLDEMGIELEFKPNTIRLRQYGKDYILTLKDRKETKKREAEWELDSKTFKKYWPLTKGARVEKKRLEKKIKGHLVEIDAFTDRFLLIAEIEVKEEVDLDKCPKLGLDITGNKQWTNKSLSR